MKSGIASAASILEQLYILSSFRKVFFILTKISEMIRDP
jgi:hypothetical protein